MVPHESPKSFGFGICLLIASLQAIKMLPINQKFTFWHQHQTRLESRTSQLHHWFAPRGGVLEKTESAKKSNW
jgi:hypothetical protein